MKKIISGGKFRRGDRLWIHLIFLLLNHMSNNHYKAQALLLVKSTVADLSQRRHRLAGANVGKYALFAGWAQRDIGNSYISGLKVVDVYDESLVRCTPIELSEGRYNLTGSNIEGHALFAGGVVGNFYTTTSDVVDMYDESLVRNTITGLYDRRSDMVSAIVGNYVLFAGGEYYSALSTVDAYEYGTEDVNAIEIPAITIYL